jgi:hypothetical protein
MQQANTKASKRSGTANAKRKPWSTWHARPIDINHHSSYKGRQDGQERNQPRSYGVQILAYRHSDGCLTISETAGALSAKVQLPCLRPWHGSTRYAMAIRIAHCY